MSSGSGSGLGGSLSQNPPNADRHITSGGSDWLWAVTAIMGLSTLLMAFWQFTVSFGILERLNA